MKVLVELNEKQNRKVELFKAANKLETKADAIAKIIDEFKIDIKLG